MRRQIWPQNLVFLTMPQLASVMIHVFPSLEHSTDCVRKPTDNFRTFVCPLWHQWTKHNRAKPMFELPSAIFLIADGNQFRFARFYIVCKEVPLGTPESPLIVCGLSDTLRECPNVAKTRIITDASCDMVRNTGFCGQNLPPHVYLELLSIYCS